MAGLIDTAKGLATANPKKPAQSNLKRAVSTAYFAMFHVLAWDCADFLIGGTAKARRSKAWRQVYRALQHGAAKTACGAAKNMKFPPEILNFSYAFVILQQERHGADYDPHTKYNRAQTLALIRQAEDNIEAFMNSPIFDRRCFAAWTLLPKPKG